MSKAKEIMERLDAIDPYEAIGDRMEDYAFNAYCAIEKAITGDDDARTYQAGIVGIRDALREAFDELEARAMPEGVEWPRFEDGEPVKLGDMALIDGDADMVEAVQIWIHGKPVIYGDNGSRQLEKAERVKRPAVPAGDGEPLEAGQTVWHEDGTELRVLGFGDVEDGETIVRVEYVCGPTRWGEVRSLSFTHTKPEPPDSYCRLYADMAGRNGNARIPNGLSFGDFMRRCRALAERERGE